MHVHLAENMVDYAHEFSFLLQMQIEVQKIFVIEKDCSLVSRIFLHFNLCHFKSIQILVELETLKWI